MFNEVIILLLMLLHCLIYFIRLWVLVLYTLTGNYVISLNFLWMMHVMLLLNMMIIVSCLHRLQNPFECPSNGSRTQDCVCRKDYSAAGYTVFQRVRLDLSMMRIISESFILHHHHHHHLTLCWSMCVCFSVWCEVQSNTVRSLRPVCFRWRLLQRC